MDNEDYKSLVEADRAAKEKLAETLRNFPSPDTVEDLTHLLPMLFSLKGKPLMMNQHVPMKQLYRRRIPKKQIFKCGRQIGKSLNMAASNIQFSALSPHFETLFVTPFFEMIRRLSSNTVRPLLTNSLVKSLLQNTRCEKSVLQKTLINQAKLHFSFAFLDCERCRGLSVDRINYDEVQGFDPAFIDIIGEAMSASKIGLACYTGTPKTMDNVIEKLWQESSMGEWVIRCGCGYTNIPALDGNADLLRMIGPLDNVTKYGSGLICAKCGRPIYGMDGFWLHRFPDRYGMFAGHHVPQIVFPMHYADEPHWADLLLKRERMGDAEFLNECMGESSDFGAKLISLMDLQGASNLPWSLADVYNPEYIASKLHTRYKLVTLGVDWGGGGIDKTSTTAIAVCGVTAANDIEVIYLERLHKLTDMEELSRVFFLYKMFGCKRLAHDFGGAGRKTDTLLRQSYEIPEGDIMPFSYTATGARELVVYHPPLDEGGRYYYSYDKTWSITLICTLIQNQYIRFPKYDGNSAKLLADFLHVVAEKRERASQSDMYLVRRSANQSDDVVHAVNFACGAIWKATDRFPDITNSLRQRLSIIRGPDGQEYSFDRAHPGHELKESDWD